MIGTNDRDLLHDAVHWLGRLPFLGVSDMSTLLSVGETRARRVLSGLEGVGWCEWVATSSPELAESRLHALTEAAQKQLAEPQPVSLPIGRRETLARLARLETTAGLNRFFAELSSATAQDIEVDLADARSLPWTAPRTRRCWPPEVEAYACLRWGIWIAPFFIAWDRAEAPPIHRRKRVSAWYTHAQSHGWDMFSILVVCPSEREAEQWARSVVNSADRRRSPLLTVFLASARAAQTDPLGAIWRRVDGQVEALLCDRLRWIPREKEPLPSRRLTDGLDLRQLPVAAVALREWAIQLADHPDKASGFERVAALSLATGPLQKTMLEWISHHALLTSSDLSTLMEIRESLADKLLAGLEARELVRPLPPSEPAIPTASRYVLTSAGLRLLAARDGVPPRRYVRYGVIAAPNEGKTSRRLETLVDQFQHTTGANSFFVRLKRDVDAAGGRLLRWLNASESTVQFTYKEKRHWLRPDGYAEFQLGGEIHRFFLEWDRGTTRHPKHLTEKFQNYADYFAVSEETKDRPDLLIVTVSPHRESVIWNILKRSFSGHPPASVLTSIDSLVERLGPFGPVWRGSSDKGRRRWA